MFAGRQLAGGQNSIFAILPAEELELRNSGRDVSFIVFSIHDRTPLSINEILSLRKLKNMNFAQTFRKPSRDVLLTSPGPETVRNSFWRTLLFLTLKSSWVLLNIESDNPNRVFIWMICCLYTHNVLQIDLRTTWQLGTPKGRFPTTFLSSRSRKMSPARAGADHRQSTLLRYRYLRRPDGDSVRICELIVSVDKSKGLICFVFANSNPGTDNNPVPTQY